MKLSKIYFSIGFVVMTISAFLSLLGLFWEHLYQDSNELILTGWWINDWVTLVVAVPLFAFSLLMIKNESLTGYALLLGLMMYSVYNFSFYLFGAAFNAAFLGYVIILVLGLFGLILGAILLYGKLDKGHLPSSKASKLISSYMLLVVIFLSIGWIGQWLDFVVTGKIPELMERFDATLHLVAALDLTFVVPWFFVGAFLLWRQQVLGLIIAFMVHLKTIIYNIILLWGSIYQMNEGIEGASDFIPVWSFFIIGSTLTMIYLLKPSHK